MAADNPDSGEPAETFATVHTRPSNLLLRVISALILIPLALAAVWLGAPWFDALLCLFGLAMFVEWLGMVGGGAWLRATFGALGLLVPLGFLYPMPGWSVVEWWAISAAAAGMLAIIGLAARWARFGWLALALIYCWTPVAALIWLRGTPDGLWWVAWVLLVVWGTDIGGYFVGRSAGGAKLVPHISPNKTWSGLFGGMALAAIAAAAAALYFALPGSLWGYGAAGAGLAVAAQAGDLVESAVKRRFGVKDSGRLIPGHGGVLDRVDGLVFVAPIVATAVALMGLA